MLCDEAPEERGGGKEKEGERRNIPQSVSMCFGGREGKKKKKEKCPRWDG